MSLYNQILAKIGNWYNFRNVAEKVAVGMIIITLVLVFVIGLTFTDLRKFRAEITELNNNAIPNITTSAELAASLQTTLANVNNLNFIESQAQRRLINEEIMLELHETSNIANRIGETTVSKEILSNLLTTIEQSVKRLNMLVEAKINSKQQLDQAIFNIIQYDVEKITSDFDNANHLEHNHLNGWEATLDQIISRAMQASQITRMRDVIVLKQEAQELFDNIPDYKGQVSSPVSTHMTSLQNGLKDMVFGSEGIFTLTTNYLSAIARTRGLENQTSLLTEEASVFVSSIFEQTRQDARANSTEMTKNFKTHTSFLIFSAIFVIISISAVYLFFRRDLVTRLINLNNQVLERVKGGRTPIQAEGNDEITDIAKSIGFFMHEIDTQQDKLRNATDQAEQANAYKTEFLANISHDIRTPLTGVKGALSLLENTKLNAKQNALVVKAQLSSEILHSIINDLLDVSRLEKGMLPLHKASVDLRSLVGGVVTMLEDLKAEKGLDVTTNIDENVPQHIYADQKRISQILFNLLSNALKFTNTGSVNIFISVDKNETALDKIEIKVVDTGIGISKKQQQVMFDRFQRFDNKQVNYHESMGLGLAICKYLVELMQGKIQVVSALEKGSTFTVSLPIEEIPQLENEQESSLTAPLKMKRNILVVEDNDINQQLIQMLLESQSHKITLVKNGKEALAIVKKNNFDLVLMDVQMPVMDGKEATKLIRALPSPKCNVPIIALTAHAMDFEGEQLLALGMNSIITKPIDIALLEKSVQTYSL